MSSSLDANDSGAPSHGEAVPGALAPRSSAGLPDARQALAPLPPALSAAPNALSLLKALRRRLFSAMTVGILLAAGVGAVAWFVTPPPKDMARAVLQVSPSQPVVLFHLDGDRSSGTTFVREQFSLVKSPLVLNSALRDPKISGLKMLQNLKVDQASWLEQNLVVDSAGPELLRISISGDDREEMKKLVHAVTKTYVEEFANKRQSDKQQDRLDTLKRVRDQQERRLDLKRKQLHQIEGDIGPANPEVVAVQQQLVEENLRRIHQSYIDVCAKAREMYIELGMPPEGGPVWEGYAGALGTFPSAGMPVNLAITAMLHRNPDTLPLPLTGPDSVMLEPEKKDVDTAFENIAQVRAWRAQILELKTKIDRQRRYFDFAKDPNRAEQRWWKATDAWRTEIKSNEKRIAAYREQEIPKITEQLRLNAEMNDKKGRLKALRQYAATKALQSLYFRHLIEAGRASKEFKEKGTKATHLRDQIASEETFLRKEDDLIQKLEVELEAPARVTWPKEEVTIVKPDVFKVKLMTAAGAAGGSLLFVLFGFSWLEFRHRRIHSPEEVVHSLGLPLVGTVPDLAQKPVWLRWLGSGGRNAIYSQHLLTESVDAARALVLHTARSEPIQIVMITSALAGEGKTSLASHLAASLARAGRRTLLIDCDLRNPALHRLFEMDRNPGLSELLREECDLAQVIRASVIGNLNIITAGQGDGAALQALSRDAIRPIFEQLRQRYDFIVVDSCPVLPVADSLLIGQHSDAVIFSLLRDVSRLPKVYAAYQRLLLLGIRMLGAVVNGTREDMYVGEYNYVSAAEETEPQTEL